MPVAAPATVGAVRRVVAVVVGLAVLAGGACGSGDGDDGTGSAGMAFDASAASSGDGSGGSGDDPAPQLEATLRRSRLFETQRSLGLLLAAGGDDDIRIGDIQLVTPLYETVPAATRDTTLPAGGRALLMPIPYGSAVCDPPDGPTELVADVDGTEVRVELDEHPAGMLAAFHERECASAEVLADVDLALTGDWVLTGPHTVEGRLDVTQRDAGVTAVVDEVQGNVIFTVTTATTAPVLTIDDATPTAGVDMTITASRCDPHALIEYKRTFKFAVEVRLGDAEPVPADVEAQGDARAALEELLRSCIG